MNVRPCVFSLLATLSLLQLAVPVSAQDEPVAADTPAEQRTPSPRLRVPREDGVIYAIPPGTAAPDGIGVTVKDSVWAGEYNTEILTYVPWEDESEIRPLPTGSAIPEDSIVRTIDGESFSLNQAIHDQPTVLIFYRGGWCPYCNAYLRDLRLAEPELVGLGYQILAVSTDTPEEISAFNEDLDLPYTLLSDASLDVAAKFGIRYKVIQTYLDHVKDLDLVSKNGGYLLTPGAFIFDQQGIIRFSYVNNNYAVRVSRDKLLDAAREIVQR